MLNRSSHSDFARGNQNTMHSVVARLFHTMMPAAVDNAMSTTIFKALHLAIQIQNTKALMRSPSPDGIERLNSNAGSGCRGTSEDPRRGAHRR